jgi:hypothetical protein
MSKYYVHHVRVTVLATHQIPPCDFVDGIKERLGEAVGIAFGLDTADRNSLETCRGCIRPGHRIPGPGEELSFVRRMVAQWEAEKWKA